MKRCPLKLLCVVLFMGCSLSADDGPQWTGYARYSEVTKTDKVTREWRMEARLVNGQGPATSTSSYKDLEDGSSGSCSGTYETTFSGEYDESTQLYGFSIPIPACSGWEILRGTRQKWGEDESAIVVEGQRGDNPRVMFGSIVETVEATVKTWEWSLVKGPVDAELIVTAENYENWLPEPPVPGADRGNGLPLRLELKGKAGGPANLRARSFELKLTGTSNQPGVSLNWPVTAADKRFDFRFLPAEGVTVLDAEGQSVRVECKDGVKAVAVLPSFDGGGWTTLSAEAILEDGSRVPGHLQARNGATAIPIPRREGESKIAAAWRKLHPSANDLADDELLPGNSHRGDGLTAYEEYRGMIAQRKFTRLDPAQMNLGVEVKPSEQPLFAGGVDLFEKATDIKILLLHEGEIGTDRVLNPNSEQAHASPQHALRLRNETLAADLGENLPLDKKGKTPAQSDKVIVDVTGNETRTDSLATVAANEGKPLPFTKAEMIANTVAHELGHGVGLDHHGKSSDEPGRVIDDRPGLTYKIFDRNLEPITQRPFEIKQTGGIGQVGGDQSGDLNCIMAYTTANTWCFQKRGANTYYYFAVPLLPVGKSLCTSATGTGINRPNREGEPGYFGDATWGDCRSKIIIKD